MRANADSSVGIDEVFTMYAVTRMLGDRMPYGPRMPLAHCAYSCSPSTRLNAERCVSPFPYPRPLPSTTPAPQARTTARLTKSAWLPASFMRSSTHDLKRGWNTTSSAITSAHLHDASTSSMLSLLATAALLVALLVVLSHRC